jgi:hypothetical protein
LVPPARIDPLQQPKGDDMPFVFIEVPLPNVPGVVADPTQEEEGLSVEGEVRLRVGGCAGTGIIGLMPELPISVAPSGIVPMPSVDPAVVPEVNGFCVPDAVPLAGTELHGPDSPTLPPPSKVVLVPVVPEAPIPGVAFPVTDIPLVPHGEVLAVEPSGPGLSPPGSSSVEPKGMPTWPTDPVPPSGDVMPIPGAPPGPVGAICAETGAPPSHSIAATTDRRRRIEISIMCFIRLQPQTASPAPAAVKAVVEADHAARLTDCRPLLPT